jgi:hypothetical protein
MITRKQALQIIANIESCNGYKETDGKNWLGPRLHELRLFIDGLPIGVVSTPETQPDSVAKIAGSYPYNR